MDFGMDSISVGLESVPWWVVWVIRFESLA